MRISLKTTLTVLLALVLSAGAWAQQLTTKKALNLAVAKQIAAAAEAEATKNKFTMVITILDDGGNLIYLEKMDDTQLGSIEVSQAKGHSAIAFKRPTKAFSDALAGGNSGILRLPGAIPVEGGLPLTADGKIIGAIGVSGGTSPQDGQVAAAGVAELAKLLGQ